MKLQKLVYIFKKVLKPSIYTLIARRRINYGNDIPLVRLEV